MAAWKKWWVAWLFIIQALLGTGTILLWYFQNEPAARLILAWLATRAGQITIVVIAGYLIVLAVATIAIAVFRPTTSKQLTIVNDGPYRVKIDKQAVEKNIQLALADYDLYNTDAKVKMHKNSRQADVTVNGILSQRSDSRHLKQSIHDHIATNLKEQFDIDLRKLRVNLKPFNHKQDVVIV